MTKEQTTTTWKPIRPSRQFDPTRRVDERGVVVGPWTPRVARANALLAAAWRSRW